MKQLTAPVLFAAALAAATLLASPRASSSDSSDVDTVKQIGQDMGDAMIAADIGKLDRIFGDDWMTIGLSGSVYTKETLLRDVRFGKKKLTWFELGPMDVRIFGDVAVVQGNVSEKRIHDGKDTDVQAVYSDILERRDGRWVVVRSMGAAVK